jgi:putative membrane protein
LIATGEPDATIERGVHMKSSFLTTLFTSVFACIAGGFLAAGTATAADKPSTPADSRFATKAAMGGMAEVQLGQLALKNSSNTDVKTFAQKMVSDHTKAGEKLKDVAAKDNIALPSDMDAKDKALYDKLSKLQGADFDKAYMKDMVKDHKTDVAEFQKEANSGGNPDLKQFAGDTLPTLQEHLKMAEDTSSKVK